MPNALKKSDQVLRERLTRPLGFWLFSGFISLIAATLLLNYSTLAQTQFMLTPEHWQQQSGSIAPEPSTDQTRTLFSFRPRCDLLDWASCSRLPSEQEMNEHSSLNLSQMTEVTVNLDYTGQAEDIISLRLHHLENNSTRDVKVNEFSFRLPEGQQQLTLPLSSFSVRNPAFLDSESALWQIQTDFSQIVLLEFSVAAMHTMTHLDVQSLIFRGYRFAQSHFNAMVLLTWLAFISLALMLQIRQMQRALVHARHHLAQLAQSNVQLQQQASHDCLTATYNRAGLEQALQQHYRNWQHEQIRFGILVMDIDHFKQINDQYGHNIGDKVLSQFGRLLNELTPEQYTVGRWGGEEFVLIAPATNPQHLAMLAERFRGAIKHHHWPKVISLTVSIGLAVIEPGETEDELFARADANLYRVKKSGRDGIDAGSTRGVASHTL